MSAPAHSASKPPFGDRAEEPAPSAQPLSIRVVSRMTAIEPDTLRMWERRYGFPKPERRKGGSRVYAPSDVEALLLIRRALASGYRPGEVVGRSVEELHRLFDAGARTTPEAAGSGPTVDAALHALANDDVVALRAALRRAADILEPRKFVTDFAHPASVRVGELWAAGAIDVRHEHVFTASLSSQLNLLLSRFEDVARRHTVLLTSLPGESHSLGLEMIAVVLASSHVTPRILGIDTPPAQIVAAVRAYGCDAVGLGIMPPVDVKKVSAQIEWMLTELPRRVPVWAGGAGASQLDLELDGLVIVPDWPALDAAIGRLPR